MDDDQELDEGKNTQPKESLGREEIRDGEHQPLLYMYQMPCVHGQKFRTVSGS